MKVHFDGGPLDGRTENPTAFMAGRTAEAEISHYQWSADSYTDHHGEEVQVWKYLPPLTSITPGALHDER